MTLNNKVLLYTAVLRLRPILIYACPVWGYAANINIKVLEVSQNSYFRNITRAGQPIESFLTYCNQPMCVLLPLLQQPVLPAKILIPALTLVRARLEMEHQVDDQSVTMEDLGPLPPTSLTD
ncbi:hypothetical protein TNCV_4767741 [Trichonephila clavipes]|nr:hypothetical protein TNCV_4767741 [Trichonephila clavipes]